MKQSPKRYLLYFIFCVTCCFLLLQFIRKDTSSAALPDQNKTAVQTTAASAYEPLKNVTVMLDPGHGGHDPGMVWGNIQEKDINLQIFQKTEHFLTDWGCTVLSTREEDLYVSLEDRVQMVAEQNADLFISLHLNAVDDDTVSSGIETYYNNTVCRNSKLFAEAIQEGLVNETGARDRGARGESQLYVIKENKIPSCLAEIGFLTSDTEGPLLLSEDYQEKIAEGIAKGILQYLSLNE